MPELVAPIVLLLVLIAISLREYVRGLKPWKTMLLGAGAVLVLGAISPADALGTIDWEVMFFLYGMFVLAFGLEHSGYLSHLEFKLMKWFKEPFWLLLAFVLGMGAASALLLNDTVAVVGAPIALSISRKSGIRAAPLLIGLALAITVGSAISPIGNPQNFIIASQPGFSSPFTEFLKYLLIPIALSLLVLTFLLWRFFPELARLKRLERDHARGNDYNAARTAFQSVVAISVLRALSGVLPVPGFPLYWIALFGAAIYLVLSRSPVNALRTDWETIFFFFGMFILIGAVWESGFFQQFMPEKEALSHPSVIVVSSLLLSQVLSNVPFVIIYLKALGTVGTKPLVLLAAGSTLAGGLTLFGAASNIIVVHAAEKRGERFPTKEFMVLGIIITTISSLIVLAWVSLIGG